VNDMTLPATPSGALTLAPTNLQEAMQFADLLSKSDIVPKDYVGKPGNVLVAIQWGMEIGLQPLAAMQNIACINGRPSLWGDAMLAICRAHHSFEWIDEQESAEGAVVRLKRQGQPECVREFTLEDAKRAGLSAKPGPWQQHPKRMMKLRARAFALRDTFPDVLRGIGSAEEAQDTPAERDMGAAEVVAPAAATRTASVKAMLGAKASGPTLDHVLQSIQVAETIEALDAITPTASQLTEADRKAARAAFRERREALTPPTVDEDGVIDADAAPVDSGAPTVSYAHVVDQILRASTEDDLAEAGQLIQALPTGQQQQDAANEYGRRIKALRAA